ncbi:RNA-binding protein MEX3B-like [Alosa sapidissima]|uniref:RNA-binding protein MEX3B-like n=1 Tax=Alosa sapidissima TaxID=34773 RepID=UPI001C0A66F7|nr:RNA-binding protein MEX3B-like [Alosa sapidissima]
MPSPLFHPDIMDHEMVVSSPQQNGVTLSRETDQESREEDHQEVLRYALDQLSLMAMEKVDRGGGMVESLDDTPGSVGETCNVNGVGGGYVDLQMLEHPGGSRESPTSCSPSPEYYGTGGYHMAGPHSHPILGEQSSVLSRKRSVNMTECVPVPSSEHVAEIVGRQGCKIKALRAKTNTYIKTPVRGEEPVFIVTGRREDVEMAKREIISAAEHFSMIRASRCKAGAGQGPGASGTGGPLPGPPNLPGQTTIQVRVPYRVVGLVVGPKGATIKRIQQQTHTYIVTPSREKDPVFEVTGMPENVDRAREEIETHITLRTGAFVDLQADNDFHSNGTDVSLEGLGAALAGGAGGLGGALWSRATHHHHHPHPHPHAHPHHAHSSSASGSPPPPPPPPPPLPLSSAPSSRKPSAYHNGGMGLDAYPPTRRATDGGSPTSPFSTGSSGGGGFSFGSDPTGLTGPPGAADDLAFEFSAANIWAPFVNGGKPQQQGVAGGGGNGGPSVAAAPSSGGPASHPQPLRRNSSGLSGGVLTPRLSPTLPVAVGSSSEAAGLLDHPLARRAQSDPLSTLAWLQTGGVGVASFSSCGGGGGGSSSSSGSSSSTGYSSCSASSLPGGSPTDSEGGGSGVGLPVAGMLGRLKSAGSVVGVGAAGLVMAAGAAGAGSRDCCVCFESEVTAALVPCGHNLFCMDCAGQICQSQEPECPKCHTPATQCIRIFS